MTFGWVPIGEHPGSRRARVLPGCCHGKFTSEKTPLWFCASGLLANPNVADLETGPVVRMLASSYVKATLTPAWERTSVWRSLFWTPHVHATAEVDDQFIRINSGSGPAQPAPLCFPLMWPLDTWPESLEHQPHGGSHSAPSGLWPGLMGHVPLPQAWLSHWGIAQGRVPMDQGQRGPPSGSRTNA